MNGILVESLQSRKFENHLNPFSVTASLIDVGRYQSADNTNYCSSLNLLQQTFQRDVSRWKILTLDMLDLLGSPALLIYP